MFAVYGGPHSWQPCRKNEGFGSILIRFVGGQVSDAQHHAAELPALLQRVVFEHVALGRRGADRHRPGLPTIRGDSGQHTGGQSMFEAWTVVDSPAAAAPTPAEVVRAAVGRRQHARHLAGPADAAGGVGRPWVRGCGGRTIRGD